VPLRIRGLARRMADSLLRIDDLLEKIEKIL
jgi:hypothetical protein